MGSSMHDVWICDVIVALESLEPSRDTRVYGHETTTAEARRLDTSGFLSLAIIFAFVAWAFSVDVAALTGACFLVGWLVGKVS